MLPSLWSLLPSYSECYKGTKWKLFSHNLVIMGTKLNHILKAKQEYFTIKIPRPREIPFSLLRSRPVILQIMQVKALWFCYIFLFYILYYFISRCFYPEIICAFFEELSRCEILSSYHGKLCFPVLISSFTQRLLWASWIVTQPWVTKNGPIEYVTFANWDLRKHLYDSKTHCFFEVE